VSLAWPVWSLGDIKSPGLNPCPVSLISYRTWGLYTVSGQDKYWIKLVRILSRFLLVYPVKLGRVLRWGCGVRRVYLGTLLLGRALRFEHQRRHSQLVWHLLIRQMTVLVFGAGLSQGMWVTLNQLHSSEDSHIRSECREKLKSYSITVTSLKVMNF
jgi:hypothetical protein